MMEKIKLVPIHARFLQPYYKYFTDDVTRYQPAEPFSNLGEAASYFSECHDRETAGYSIVRIILNEQGDFTGSIEANALTGAVPSVGLWVADDMRHKGYATAALDAILHTLREKGFRYALYETDVRNIPAISLLKHFAYSEAKGPIETLQINENKELQIKKFVLHL